MSRGSTTSTTSPSPRRSRNSVISACETPESADLGSLASFDPLETVIANEASIAKLPEGTVKSLRRLEILSTSLSDNHVEDFARRHPKCPIRHRWRDSLLAAVKGSTRSRVRSGGICCRRPKEETLYELKDAAKIRGLLQRFTTDESSSCGACFCCGSPSFEFYRGDKLVVAISFHHAQSLRWEGGWPGDASLTPASALFLCRFLKKHGVEGPMEEFNQNERKKNAAEKREAR
jgi:hypothetical protein